MTTENKKGWFRAFWDFFVLFSGISTASNLERTQGRALGQRGLFLIRRPGKQQSDSLPVDRDSSKNR
jgi:hypothetical protein